MACDQRFVSRGFPVPPLPEDFPVRLWRLEDRSGLLLEEFARRWLLPEHRATDWRSGDLPTACELRAMMEWVCSVGGGVAVMLMDHTQPWPYIQGDQLTQMGSDERGTAPGS